jgi:hypothetical protein
MARHHPRTRWSLCDRKTRSSILAGALSTLLSVGCIDPSLEEPLPPSELGGEPSEQTRETSPDIESPGAQEPDSKEPDSKEPGGNDSVSKGPGTKAPDSKAPDTNSPNAKGLGTNGLGTNGLGTNGLGTNGLGTSGLSISGMNSAAFTDWFNQDPALTAIVMKYVVACAVEAGASRTWTNPVTSTEYTWDGNLGLTPDWASGAPATEVEQQVITACLAAHTNKYGVAVPISIQGLSATGAPIPVGPQEFLAFSEKEACFFGNLFQGEGIFAGNDALWSVTNSSVRACGIENPSSGNVNKCPPIQHVRRCTEICVPDALGNYFQSCTHEGKTYRAMTTRIRPGDIYVCGDGVCQISESCGSGLTPDSCMDCGPCP